MGKPAQQICFEKVWVFSIFETLYHTQRDRTGLYNLLAHSCPTGSPFLWSQHCHQLTELYSDWNVFQAQSNVST